MHLEITTKIGCTNNCIYCPQQALVQAYRKRSARMLMDMDLYKICIDKLPQSVIVDFAGFCEPWLNPHATDMILYAHDNSHAVSVYTTLVGMSLRDVSRLEKIQFDPEYGFVVHLPSIEKYEHILVDNRYMDVLKKIVSSTIPLRFHTHGKATYPAIAAIVQKKYQIRVVRPNSISGHVRIKEVCPAPERKRGKLRCSRGLMQNILLPNGDVALCCQDFGLQHILDNLVKKPYKNLFTSPEYQNIQNGLKNNTYDILCRYCHFSRNDDLIATLLNKKINVDLP